MYNEKANARGQFGSDAKIITAAPRFAERHRDHKSEIRRRWRDLKHSSICLFDLTIFSLEST